MPPTMHYTLDRDAYNAKRFEIRSTSMRRVMDSIARMDKDRLSSVEIADRLRSEGLMTGSDEQVLLAFRSMLSRCFNVLGIMSSDKQVRAANRGAVRQQVAGGLDEAAVRAIVENAAGEIAAAAQGGVDVAAISDAIEKRINASVSARLTESLEVVRKDVAELIAKQAPVRVELKANADAKPKALGLQHHRMPVLLKAISARRGSGHRLNVWLTGPAGSGKTTAASECAKALGLAFYFTGALDNAYGLLGFVDAKGKTVRTQFREAYEHGGVFLFDEVDGSAASAVLALNAALANGHCAFPDGVVARHPDFVCVAAANTWGLGGTTDYVGRMKQDAAFLDRFVQMAWDVDENLELATCAEPDWARRVQKVRAAVRKLGLKVIVSPRASYDGAALLAAGLEITDVEEMVLRRAMTDEQWRAVQQAL